MERFEAPPPPEVPSERRPIGWGRLLLTLVVTPPLLILGRLGYDAWKRHRSARQEPPSASAPPASAGPRTAAVPTPASTQTEGPAHGGPIALAHASFSAEDFQEFRSLLGDVIEAKKPLSSEAASVGGLVIGNLVVYVYDESLVKLPDFSAWPNMSEEAKDRIRASQDPYLRDLRLVRNNGLGEPEVDETFDMAALGGAGSGSIIHHPASQTASESWDIQAVARTGKWVAYAACRSQDAADAKALLPAVESVTRKVLSRLVKDGPK